MGKAALLIVTATILASWTIYLAQDRQAIESVQNEAAYEHMVLSREIAQSALNVVVARAKKDFANHRGSWTDVSYAGGEYDITASGPSAGPIELTVTGKFEGAEYEVTATLEKSGTAALDAVTVDAPVKKVEFKDDAYISGMDTNTDGSDGSLDDVHAVRVTMSSGYSYFEDNMIAGLGPGIDGDPDLILDFPDVDVNSIIAAIEAYSGAGRIDYDDDAEFKDETIGSAASPAVVVVDGKATMKEDFTGYGVLLVKGILKVEKKNTRWEGLVIAMEDGGKYELKGEEDSGIYGALIIVSSEDGGGSADDAGLPGGHFDVDVFEGVDQNKIYHEHQFDDDYDTSVVDLMAPTGCKNGALCWDEVMTGQAESFVEFINPISSWATYSIVSAGGAVPDVDLNGATEDGLGLTLFDASTVSEFYVDFTALCALLPTSPGDVQGDDNNREGAFAIRIYDATWDAGSWVQGDMVYETSVYHHDKDATQCAPGTSDGANEGGDPPTGQEIEYKMEKTMVVQYSAEALSRLTGILPMIDPSSGAIRLTNVVGVASSLD